MIRTRALILAVLLATGVGCSDPTGPEDGGDPVQAAPVIEYFVASQDTVRHGDWSSLRWKGSGEASGFIHPGIGALDHLN